MTAPAGFSYLPPNINPHVPNSVVDTYQIPDQVPSNLFIQNSNLIHRANSVQSNLPMNYTTQNLNYFSNSVNSSVFSNFRRQDTKSTISPDENYVSLFA